MQRTKLQWLQELKWFWDGGHGQRGRSHQCPQRLQSGWIQVRVGVLQKNGINWMYTIN